MLAVGLGLWIGSNALFVLALVAASWVKPKPYECAETVMVDVTRLLRGAARIELAKRDASQRAAAAPQEAALPEGAVRPRADGRRDWTGVRPSRALPGHEHRSLRARDEPGCAS